MRTKTFNLLFIFSMLQMQTIASVVVIPPCPSHANSTRKINKFTVPQPLVSSTSEEPLEFILRSNHSFSCSKDATFTTLKMEVNSMMFTKFGHFGRFSIINDTNVTIWYDTSKFCASWESEGVEVEAEYFQIGFCQLPKHKTPTKVFKCCAPGYIADLRTQTKMACEPLRNRTWAPTWYDPASFQQGACATESKRISDYQFVTRRDTSASIFLLKHTYSTFHVNITEPGTWWYLLEDGRLRSRKSYPQATSGSELYDEWKNSPYVGPGFCVDGLVNSHHAPEHSDKISEIAMIDMNTTFLVVRKGNNTARHHENELTANRTKYRRIKTISSVAAFLLASVFLAAILFKSLLKSHKRNVFTSTLLTSTASLSMSNLLFAISTLLNFSLNVNDHQGIFCIGVAASTHYFMLTSGSWLLLIALELILELRVHLPADRRPIQSLRRYWFYVALVFGSLLIIVGWLYYQDRNYGPYAWHFSTCPVLVPGYGKDSCFLSLQVQDKMLYSPLMILNAVGLTLCILALWRLYVSKIPPYSALMFVCSNARRDPRLTLVLQLLAVESLSFSVDLLALLSKPHVRHPLHMDPSAFLVALSIIMTVGRAGVLCWILHTQDNYDDQVNPDDTRSLTTTRHVDSCPNPDQSNLSLNSHETLELETAQISPPTHHPSQPATEIEESNPSRRNPLPHL